jgi:hypothetical protein
MFDSQSIHVQIVNLCDFEVDVDSIFPINSSFIFDENYLDGLFHNLVSSSSFPKDRKKFNYSFTTKYSSDEVETYLFSSNNNMAELNNNKINSSSDNNNLLQLLAEYADKSSYQDCRGLGINTTLAEEGGGKVGGVSSSATVMTSSRNDLITFTSPSPDKHRSQLSSSLKPFEELHQKQIASPSIFSSSSTSTTTTTTSTMKNTTSLLSTEKDSCFSSSSNPSHSVQKNNFNSSTPRMLSNVLLSPPEEMSSLLKIK